MNPHEDGQDEARLESLLNSAEANAVPPDADLLARLRTQSTEAFSAYVTEKKKPSFLRGSRWLATAAALVLVIGVYFWLSHGKSGIPLGQVLENVDKADTLHARFVRGDRQTELWHTSQPNRSRWNHDDGTYDIANENQFWSINEKVNQAQRWKHPLGTTADAFLGMLSIESADKAKIFAALPVERIREGEVDLYVYRTELSDGEGPCRLEARVVAQTGRLRSIRVRFHKAVKVDRELTILAYDEPIDASKFVIADTLTEDGRIGNVTDVQGIVTVKPVLHERWTPVRQNLVLKPGDWVRTDARGANATALRLVKNTGVILGPRTLVELSGPKRIRLIEGEIEITPSAGAAIELVGPGDKTITVNDKQLYRVQKQQLVRVEKDPAWLLGFKGASTNESLGSLVALVDGRNVPLTVGYHKVTVDIRDQIARTVVEESFVNHTDAQLEGVFHFPLPADASISGFGMWIGDNLIEADVVEKQRAREIYETILRERRDPGLLEWSGGNIFKARVFPILPHSEKRIKISYTQVLPLKGNRYRYSYALQSELLQQHPLRRMDIDVKVNSVASLKSVTSPTHPTRDALTLHSAHVEFTAEEYTPTRDFEVVVETEGRQSDVVLIPHRRGDDGYFMLQLTPPGGAANWDRPLLPNGEPLQLLILADTSASIDASQRATQATFIGSLLASLSSKDMFNLAACDVNCDWVFAQPAPVDNGKINAARDFLAARSSLGWTNLDGAFAAALKQCGPKTQVIYVGDGIVTTGDADPVAFSNRLRRLYQGHAGTFHAVSLGSSYEAGVLKTIASLGGGSLRKITGEQSPQAVALELLSEIAQPSLRDIKVEFKDIKVARLYPETLANVPAGSQQILLGRYLPFAPSPTPGGKGIEVAEGEVIVTGVQAGKPVRFSTRVALKDAELGNSFIPRLWARMHLDSLLEQGASDAIRDEIISLSEEYKIITPYTSFLVLETDADRERFKVKRRFQMRDGERFFADGRDNALFDLAQKQMKKAGDWRTALRRSVLSDLAKLGRDPDFFRSSPIRGGIVRGSFEYEGLSLGSPVLFDRAEKVGEVLIDRTRNFFSMIGRQEERRERGSDKSQEVLLFLEDQAILDPFSRIGGLPGPFDGEGDFRVAGDNPSYLMMRGFVSEESPSPRKGKFYFFRNAGWSNHPDAERFEIWFDKLFPPLREVPRVSSEPESSWPPAARALAKSLLRTDQLAKLKGGIEIVRQTETFDTHRSELKNRSRRLELVSASSWLTRSSGDGEQTLVSWCDAKQTGVFSQAFQLGRLRDSTPLDVQRPPLELNDHSLESLEKYHSRYAAAVEPQGKDRAVLVLKNPNNQAYETRYLIDTARHVILSIETRRLDKVTSTTRFDDFIEAGGTWWARRIETTDNAGRRRSLVTQTIKTLPFAEVDQRMRTELSGRAQVQFVQQPMPSVASAKKAIAAGKASFDDQFSLMNHYYASEQWPRVLDHLRQAEMLAVGKPGLRWLRSAILYDARRHEELRLRYQEDAMRLAKAPASPEAYFLAQYILRESKSILQANEMLTLADVLRPVYDTQPPHLQANKSWLQLRASYLDQAGRTDDALRIQKQLATDYPHDSSLQREYVRALAVSGDYPAAYAWLTRVLVKEANWRDTEEEELRKYYTGLLNNQGRAADLAAYLADWVKQNPVIQTAYDQYLGALIKADQMDKAEALALGWLKDAQIPGELSKPVESRLNAAVALMLGRGHGVVTRRIEERWLSPLGQAVLFFARHKTHASTAGQIMRSGTFQRTEEYQRIQKKIADILILEVDKLPAEQVGHFVEWSRKDDAEPAAWAKVTATLRQRWATEPKDDKKSLLGDALVRLLGWQESPSDLLAFLRLQWRIGPEKYRAQYASALYETLLEQPWSPEIEDEAFGLFDKQTRSEDPGERLWDAVGILYRLTDRLLDARIAHGKNMLKHPEKLTRTEFLKKQEEIRRSAQEGLVERLLKESAKHSKTVAPWLVVESLYLDVQLDRNLKQVAAEAWKYLAAPPAQLQIVVEFSREQTLAQMLQERCLITLMNLAARKGADAALIDRLVKFFDKAIADDPSGNRWKDAKTRLFIALDRRGELEQTLRQWTRPGDSDNRWRIALGYLLAEQGNLPEAIQQLERVEADDELSPDAYRSLADWYLVQNQKAKHERATGAIYGATPEHELSQMLEHKLYPWQHGDRAVPTELDKEVPRIFAVLFEKSSSPRSYLKQLGQFYQACHDFRLLACLPDAVIGHTAEEVYPFLQGMQSVLAEIRDEATADEIFKRLDEVRPRAKTVVDERALDLLEALVARRASEIQNQPGPQVARALTALQRASKRAWSPGEQRLMADFLASMGKIGQAPLADEQLRQLKALAEDATKATQDRLHITHDYATTVHAYGRTADAIDVLQSALDAFQSANIGVLPVSANDSLSAIIVWHEEAGHFARGEKLLLAQLTHPVHAQQSRWLIERLDRLYHRELVHDGEVSLGKGLRLYQALDAKIQKDFADPDQDHRYQLMTLLYQVFRTAHEKKLPNVVADLRAFTSQILPPLLKQQTTNHESLVGTIAVTLHDLAGPRDGISFLLNEIENEPRWLRFVDQGGWNQHAAKLADWRKEAKDLGDVEPRLLKVVLEELRRYLEGRGERHAYLFSRRVDNSRFWKEKTADFAKTAESVLAERSKSNQSVQAIAHYFYWGLDLHPRAIEILLSAEKQKILDDDGRKKLVDFLHRQGRFGESIALLRPMIERHPETIRYRVHLMHAYFRTARKNELLALLKDTDVLFHQKDWWDEHTLHSLADSTLQNELYEQSVAYFKELIPLQERTHPDQGVGDGALSGYYIGLANAYAGLNKTPEAVEAAGAAIVAWGPRSDQRGAALQTLKKVLLRSPDLEAFVALLDQKKEDSAIIRKALGQAYEEKGKHTLAIKQLNLALLLQPNDVDIHQLLIASYDKAGDKDAAVRQLLQAAQLTRRQLKLYQDLGERYVALEQPKEAERAFTSIVEMQPNESESHTLLATIREKQNRWPEAIVQWEQVARLRALEPTGLLKLASAQIHEKQWDAARATLRKLETRTWPARFGDVPQQIRWLEEELKKREK